MTARFYFHIFNECLVTSDDDGLICDSVAAAFQQAATIALELSVDEDDWGAAIEVCDDTGIPLAWFISSEIVIDCRAGLIFWSDGPSGLWGRG